MRAEETEQRGRAWLAWFIARLPMLKKFPDAKDFIGGPKKVQAKQAPDTIDTNMRKWRAVMAQVETQASKRKGG